MVLDLNQHMQDQKLERASEFKFIMEIAMTFFMKVDPTAKDADYDLIAANCFKAADAMFKQINKEQKARI